MVFWYLIVWYLHVLCGEMVFRRLGVQSNTFLLPPMCHIQPSLSKSNLWFGSKRYKKIWNTGKLVSKRYKRYEILGNLYPKDIKDMKYWETCVRKIWKIWNTGKITLICLTLCGVSLRVARSILSQLQCITIIKPAYKHPFSGVRHISEL